ncbi:MAG: bifunctional oligoribonuclease/PAP phosphatase NrnA [Clostridia bacterium]|nr:bifunctional oligoribonuclease/PAP phosphatase NrnA [Clostridia bacterium]
MTLDSILEEIKKADKIVILTHENPDGDAVASSLSMKIALKELGKEADVIMDECPKTYRFLPEAKNIKKETEIEEYDLAISVDASDLKRVAGGSRYFETAKRKIVIDHHSSNTMFGDYNFVNPVSPACCEIILEMLKYFNIDIKTELGTCIICGIITDTGGFQYSGVNAETFEFAAELLRTGVNIPQVYKKALKTKTKSSFELTRLATERMEFLEDGKITFTYINCEDEKRVNAQEGDHEGIVEEGRDIEGVEVSIFIREKEGANGYKVSLRSNEYVNVADVALMLGGGGHIRAAGCFIAGNVEEVKNKIITEIKQVI